MFQARPLDKHHAAGACIHPVSKLMYCRACHTFRGHRGTAVHRHAAVCCRSCSAKALCVHLGLLRAARSTQRNSSKGSLLHSGRLALTFDACSRMRALPW